MENCSKPVVKPIFNVIQADNDEKYHRSILKVKKTDNKQKSKRSPLKVSLTEPRKKQHLRTFQMEWLKKEAIKACVLPVNEDPTRFYCKICNNTYAANSLTHIKRHLASETHVCKATNTVKQKPKSPPCKFDQRWLQLKKFKHWLAEVPENPYSFKCTVCSVVLSCGTGVANLYKHNMFRDHIWACDDMGLYIDEDQDSVIENYEKRLVEIEKKIADAVVENDIPINAAADIVETNPTDDHKSAYSFKKYWLDFPEFKPWLEEVPGASMSFSCKLCSVVLSCASGLTSVFRHHITLKHVHRCQGLGIEMSYDMKTSHMIKSLKDRAREMEYACAEVIANHQLNPKKAAKFLKVLLDFNKTDPDALTEINCDAVKLFMLVNEAKSKRV